MSEQPEHAGSRASLSMIVTRRSRLKHAAFITMGMAAAVLVGCAPAEPTLQPTPEPFTGAGGVVSSTGNCTYDAELAAELNYPAGTEVTSGQPIIKTWQIKNTGTCAWDNFITLRQVDGALLLAEQDSTPLPITGPGNIVEINVPVVLSRSTLLGQQEAALFRLHTPDGRLFGPELYITVISGSAAAGEVGLPNPLDPATCNYSSEIASAPSLPDNTPISVGATFSVTWQLKNTGNCPWDGSFKLVNIGGDLPLKVSTDVPAPNTLPGQVAELTASLTLDAEAEIDSEYFAGFQLLAPDGIYFGDTPYVLIKAVRPGEGAENDPVATGAPDGAATPDTPLAETECVLDSEFVRDVTMPDGTTMEVGALAIKTWQMRNTGTCAWDSSVILVQTGGTLLRATDIATVPPAGPGQVTELSVRVQLSPDAPPGEAQRATFQLRIRGGEYFGARPFVEVYAVSQGFNPNATATPSP